MEIRIRVRVAGLDPQAGYFPSTAGLLSLVVLRVTVPGSVLQLSSDDSTSITKLEEKEGKGRK